MSVANKCVILLAFHFTWYGRSLCLYMRTEKRSPEVFLISQKRARTMLTACWVCSIFSSKNRSQKILSFILSFCEFVQCSTALAVDWSTSSLCLLPLLLGLGWADLWSCWVTVFLQRFPSSGFYTSHVGVFLRSPFVSYDRLNDFTSLVRLYLAWL